VAGRIPATSGAEAIDALAQAMMRIGYVLAEIQDNFRARVAADVLIRELRMLSYMVSPITTAQSAARSESIR
jgi:hypothetical protein